MSKTKNKWLLLWLNTVTLCRITKSLQNTTPYTITITISTVQVISDKIPSKETEALEIPVASAVPYNSCILLSAIYLSYCKDMLKNVSLLASMIYKNNIYQTHFSQGSKYGLLELASSILLKKYASLSRGRCEICYLNLEVVFRI